MPGRLWRFSKAWTAGCQYGMKGESSLPRRRRPARYSSETATGVPHPFLSFFRRQRIRRTLDRDSPNPGLKGREREGSRDHHRQRSHSRQAQTVSPRKPTFLQRERWKVIQKARRKGMSLRAIERDLGIHRGTVRKYLDSMGPPPRQPRAGATTSASDTMAP